ncbi:ABC transporter ATP-binding protein [Kibdelosporangium lantanae]
MYTLTGVTKNHRKNAEVVTALRDVDLEVADGEWLVVQGHTGGGKTTLLHLLGGLDRPTSGMVTLNGADLTTMSEAALTRVRAETVGFVFQTFNLIPTLTAAENVEAGLIPLGLTPAERRGRVAGALADVGLTDRSGHLPSELSGGQQQRVGIARALAKRPKVVLADEPTGNLDEDTRDEIIELLERVWRAHGLTLVLVTHDPAVAGRAPRVADITRGRLTIRCLPTKGTPA